MIERLSNPRVVLPFEGGDKTVNAPLGRLSIGELAETGTFCRISAGAEDFGTTASWPRASPREKAVPDWIEVPFRAALPGLARLAWSARERGSGGEGCSHLVNRMRVLPGVLALCGVTAERGADLLSGDRSPEHMSPAFGRLALVRGGGSPDGVAAGFLASGVEDAFEALISPRLHACDSGRVSDADMAELGGPPRWSADRQGACARPVGCVRLHGRCGAVTCPHRADPPEKRDLPPSNEDVAERRRRWRCCSRHCRPTFMTTRARPFSVQPPARW